MLAVYEFPAWEPDKLTPGTLADAKNVLPIATGYAPSREFDAITVSLEEDFSGGGAFIDSTGVSTLLAATPTALKKYASGWNTITTVSTSDRWNFAQFGDNVLCANGGPLRSVNLVSGTDSVPTDAPEAKDCAQVRDFVFALTTDNKWRWCQFNNSSNWTIGENQADEQPILSGFGVAIIGGEYAIGLRTTGIDRISYVGGDVIFQFDEISAEIGCITKSSVANTGKLVFFWSERGPMICDGQTVVPIAEEKWVAWFFSRFSRQDMEGMWTAIDPRKSVVKWAMPGTPGLIVNYNWQLQRASYEVRDVAAIFTGYTSYTSLEELDALYPSGLDSIDVSLDSPLFSGGAPLLLVVNADNQIGSLTGSNLEATFRVTGIEPTPGRRSRIRNLRPITDATSASATVVAKMRQGDTESSVSTSSMRTNGKLPIRCNGRYNDVTLTIPAGEAWTQAQGVECEFEAGDGR